MLPKHDVFITDWRDAKLVPLTEGSFDLDDYIDYLIEFLELIGERPASGRTCWRCASRRSRPMPRPRS